MVVAVDRALKIKTIHKQQQQHDRYAIVRGAIVLQQRTPKPIQRKEIPKAARK